MGPNRRERILLTVAAIFVCVGGITLHLAYAQFDVRALVIACCVFLVTFVTAHLTLCHHLPDRDPFLLPVGAFLSGWGILVVGRVAPNFLPRQATWLMLGAVAMMVAAEIGQGLHWLRRYRYTWLAGGLALLAATLLLGVNPSGSGPRLWLGLGGAYFQPSEPLKLLLTVFLASYLAQRRKLLLSEVRDVGPLRLPPLAYVGPLLVMFGLAVLLLVAQQDLGAAMLLFLTFLSMLFLATGQWTYVAAGLVLFVLAGLIGYNASARLARRVDAWLNPWAGAADWSFQIVQSLLAFGTGGILGEGLGLGRPTYIPAVHTDFTFAAIGEAYGLVGVLGVIGLYGILLFRGFRAAAGAVRRFERYLAAGLTAGLIIQAWVIMAANVKLAPIAGVTLPFLSYGGSSLISTFVVLGLLLRISSGSSGWSQTGRTSAAKLSPEEAAAQSSIHQTVVGLAAALVALALACGYWTVVRADWLVARQDNPRRVSYERRIVRGRILDRNGQTLADVTLGPSGFVTRTYPVSEAAPVIGYASPRYGTGGIEDAFDGVLRGEAGRGPWAERWSELLHRPPHGRSVRLTLDADLQRGAQEALAGESGAAVVLDVASGGVLAMGAVPTFDPAHLDEEWERLREDPSAPLVNRATQGLYQPGAALQTIVVAEALSRELISDLDVEVGASLTERVSVDGMEVGCAVPPEGSPSLANAYAAGCPAPIGSIGEDLGRVGLEAAVKRWGLTDPPSLVIPTEAPEWDTTQVSSVAIEAMGQGALTVSPLQMAMIAATVANGGWMEDPWLVLGVEDDDGTWQRVPSSTEGRRILAPSDADRLFAAWRQWDKSPAPDEWKVVGHWGLAVAGEGPPHAWFLGAILEAETPRYGAAVLIEHAPESRHVVSVGCELLVSALESSD